MCGSVPVHHPLKTSVARACSCRDALAYPCGRVAYALDATTRALVTQTPRAIGRHFTEEGIAEYRDMRHADVAADAAGEDDELLAAHSTQRKHCIRVHLPPQSAAVW